MMTFEEWAVDIAVADEAPVQAFSRWKSYDEAVHERYWMEVNISRPAKVVKYNGMYYVCWL